ncbi:probable leucine-rich repeat receptor-like protein kinase At1g35710 [Camellia sinensis]|uniref:probable leucine-rich repeat receptor-like protein kinase At1g35710 n=1 Tax=Camellia sinensis TaxID=4442 RepID=UPI001035B1B2|nr:probable leucine-rich repeat receptor-like protein kinase At1g35710 [Camellia sinensis]
MECMMSNDQTSCSSQIHSLRIEIADYFCFLFLSSNLRWNKLQDVIPPEIGELKSLTHLYLSFNNFKGEIPKELANLPLLRYLYLHENHFIGRIPPELGTLQQLRHFDVGNNHLVGTIRQLIRIEGCFPSLRNLYLNNNYLTGGIPAQLANLTNLEILHLSYNKMSGYHTIWTCSYSPIDFLVPGS